MPQYTVNMNAQANGDHEVHNLTTGCNFMPNAANRIDLGAHADCHGAVTRAKAYYPQSNGCYYCCNACHTG